MTEAIFPTSIAIHSSREAGVLPRLRFTIFDMAKLIHEIWEVLDDRGHALQSVCLVGPDGEGFRKLLHDEALENGRGPPRCVGRFEAGSHFEAMTIYYQHNDRGEYTTDFATDHDPYSDDWAQRQSLGTN